MNAIYAIVPAAGVGARMRAGRPKQYLALGARTLLERAVDCLLADARVREVLVVVSPGDEVAARLPGLRAAGARCRVAAAGGATRAQTVRNGLRALAARNDDWILVHDAARPCLGTQELAELIAQGGDEDGALLALPLSDTVKRERAGRVEATVARDGLWRALTPQFFRHDVLARALERGADDAGVTDEASAVEALGLHPRLVPGSAGNLKVTAPGDLALAEAVLRQQGRW